MKRKLLVTAFFALVPLASLLADGAGGLLCGFQTSAYPFLQNVRVVNNNFGLAYYGGYGYSVHNHLIHGGFGYVMTDPSGQTAVAGGFGGFITGVRIVEFPISLSIMSWTALGGLHTEALDWHGTGRGFLVASEELTLELGVPIARWFMPVAFAGYQVAGNLAPGQPFQDFVSYTPVVGLRFVWGRHY